MLEDLIKNQPQLKRQDDSIREPIKRSKAKVQTIFITKGYAWSQSSSSVSLYIPFEKANEIPKACYSLSIQEKSIELNINLSKKGVTYNFKISHLYDCVKPDKSVVKYKSDKIVIILEKLRPDVQWADLRSKTTQETYNELERYEKQYQPVTPEHFSTDFGTPSPAKCPHHKNEEMSDSHINDGNVDKGSH
ncbi:unnamed protein product [Mucor hiemalis]